MWAGVLTLNVVQKLPYYDTGIRHFKCTKSASCLSRSSSQSAKKIPTQTWRCLAFLSNPFNFCYKSLGMCHNSQKLPMGENAVFSYDLGYQADVDCVCP